MPKTTIGILFCRPAQAFLGRIERLCGKLSGKLSVDDFLRGFELQSYTVYRLAAFHHHLQKPVVVIAVDDHGLAAQEYLTGTSGFLRQGKRHFFSSWSLPWVILVTENKQNWS
jgi:hypothetical protein